jgi:hypothetical protein
VRWRFRLAKVWGLGDTVMTKKVVEISEGEYRVLFDAGVKVLVTLNNGVNVRYLEDPDQAWYETADEALMYVRAISNEEDVEKFYTLVEDNDDDDGIQAGDSAPATDSTARLS